MRVLVLSQHYWPEPLPKAHEIAEGLRERGHDVAVVTGFPNYPSGRIYAGYRMRPWTVETLRGVNVIRVALYPNHSRSVFHRILNYLSFAASSGLLAPFMISRPDVILAIHPPLTIGLAAWLICVQKRTRFVLAVGDLWPEAITASEIGATPAVIRAIEWLGRFVYRRAALIAVVTPPMIDHFVRKGVARERLDILPDWADERVHRPAAPDGNLAARLGMAGRFNVVFAGQLGVVQRLDTVIAAADRLRARADIQFVLIGDGVERERLTREAERRGLGNILFLGFMPPAEIPGIYALAGVLLVHLSGHEVFRLSIPGKLYTYMASARPILAAVDGITADMVMQTGAGLACPPENPKAMADAILRLAGLPPSARQEMGRRARQAFLSSHSRAIGVQRVELLLARVTQRQHFV